ncbi:polysaccharide deacetylase family sporulation protein PdaB [Bacillaceae bacterium S4-13-56]
MAHFYTFRWNRWKMWMVVVIASLFSALYLFFETSGAYSVFSSDEEPRALLKSGQDENEIALTFNITWGQERVLDILETLNKHGVKATFFVSGEWAERHPDLLEAIIEDKHELGMLGYRYKSYVKMEKDQVRKDLLYAKEVFKKLGYDDITMVRPPNGHFNKEILTLAEQLGFKVIHWSLNTEDWRNPGTSAIVDTVVSEVKGGDIILLHASDTVKYTDKALNEMIPILKQKKLSFVPISHYLSQAESNSSEIND